MINMPYELLTFFVIASSMIWCHIVAKRRGLKAVFWGVMGLLFGPLAIPFVYLVKVKKID